MSNLCGAVEKITESIVGNINVKWSFGLAANDKRREGVVSPRASSHFAVLVQRDLRPLLFHRSYAGVFLLPPVRHAGIHPDLQHEKVVFSLLQRELLNASISLFIWSIMSLDRDLASSMSSSRSSKYFFVPIELDQTDT